MSEKCHFLEFNFPSAGLFYADTDCKTQLFIGQLEIYEDKIRIKVLQPIATLRYDGSSCYYCMYSRLRENSNYNNIVSWSFFGCKFDTDYRYIYFDSFANHDNCNNLGFADGYINIALQAVNDNNGGDFENGAQLEGKIKKNESLPTFITTENKFTCISVNTESLDEWLWEQPLDAKLKNDFRFGVNYIDKYGESFRYCNNAGEFNKNIEQIVIPTHVLNRRIVINKDLAIELHSAPEVYGEYPNFKIWQNSHIKIISKTQEPIKFFYEVIRSLSIYFTIIGFGKCKIHNIYYFEPIELLENKEIKPPQKLTFYNNHLLWYIQKKKYNNWFALYDCRYQNMQEDFDKSVKKFFQKQKSLRSIVQFLANMDSTHDNEYLENYIIQQVQQLEIYGHIKSKGENKKNNVKDLEQAIKLLPDDVFDKIFIHNYPDNSLCGRKIFGDDKDKQIGELKEKLREILTSFRNFIVHPYEKGKCKKLKDTKLPKFYYNDDRLNLWVISNLSKSLELMLRWFLFKEISLEKYLNI